MRRVERNAQKYWPPIEPRSGETVDARESFGHDIMVLLKMRRVPHACRRQPAASLGDGGVGIVPGGGFDRGAADTVVIDGAALEAVQLVRPDEVHLPNKDCLITASPHGMRQVGISLRSGEPLSQHSMREA